MPNPLLARIVPWLLLPLYVCITAIVVEFTAPIVQAPAHHAFADTRALLGIPNFADVASNLAILLPALAGFSQVCCHKAHARFGSGFSRAFAWVFFASLIIVGTGSTWYHLAPDDHRLLFDRLPIALAFTSLIGWLLAERTWLRPAGAAMLLPWVLAGPAAVVWWYAGVAEGGGDLRPYLVLYAFAFVVPPLLMRLPSPYNRRGAWWTAYLAFVAGMVCDRLDHQIFALLGGLVSGHTLKHLLMGVAIATLARMLFLRRLRFR